MYGNKELDESQTEPVPGFAEPGFWSLAAVNMLAEVSKNYERR